MAVVCYLDVRHHLAKAILDGAHRLLALHKEWWEEVREGAEEARRERSEE